MPIFPKPNEFSNNFKKKSPLKIWPLLIKAVAGSVMKHGKRKQQEKMSAAETKAQSTQFQTPEAKTKAVDTDIKLFSGPKYH